MASHSLLLLAMHTELLSMMHAGDIQSLKQIIYYLFLTNSYVNSYLVPVKCC